MASHRPVEHGIAQARPKWHQSVNDPDAMSDNMYRVVCPIWRRQMFDSTSDRLNGIQWSIPMPCRTIPTDSDRSRFLVLSGATSITMRHTAQQQAATEGSTMTHWRKMSQASSAPIFKP
ncbi:hypothetical protein PSTG_07626 [Puccinia striiformis f. sp. tritici PST-78]|uniref:Uncharacterized protein n=1 Tax=Puccinia striiformis f. sp. tritici PST-78 TaxID=1165861 RepID=A0A0L0VJH4_9BASI|nr:hypothetical protein PSTG_07626 [Puccinia striiformis f. sp. tritici PST-78]